MKPHDVKYSFSPSLLDSFQGLLDSEESWDKYWGISDSPSKSLEEYEAELYDGLINAINRVPFSSEAAAKGTAFNDLVDTMLHKCKCGNTFISRVYDVDNKTVIAAQCVLKDRGDVDTEYRFQFDIELAKSAAEYFDDCISQALVNSYIDTKYGVVNLYGYIDELRRDVVYDIKTTSKYDFGNYGHKWQRHVYPYCLIESGLCTDIKEFEYTIFALKGGNQRNPIITADMYREVYTYDHEQSRRAIKEHCERFIEFIEANRGNITSDLIFHEHEHNH